MTGRAGRERWLLAGQDLLRTGGIAAVKLDAMTAATGLTTGSFYHHFSGMAAFLDLLARYYGADQVDALLDRIRDRDPRGRLRGLAELAQDRQMRPLDAAMRDWAGSNDTAAEAVRAADAALLGFVETAFAELGHGEQDARLRALVLLSVGVAHVHSPWPAPPNAPDRLLDLLARP